MRINFDSLREQREPTKKEAVLYRAWVSYLKDSKLNSQEIHVRAAAYASMKRKVPCED